MIGFCLWHEHDTISVILYLADQRAAVLAEIVKRAIAKYKEQQPINLVTIKQQVCSDLKYAGRVPKTVEILGAIPAKYNFLVGALKAKPVRSASGIAVVAVMCKPHRCPHITMTGNICVCKFPCFFFCLLLSFG